MPGRCRAGRPPGRWKGSAVPGCTWRRWPRGRWPAARRQARGAIAGIAGDEAAAICVPPRGRMETSERTPRRAFACAACVIQLRAYQQRPACSSRLRLQLVGRRLLSGCRRWDCIPAGSKASKVLCVASRCRGSRKGWICRLQAKVGNSEARCRFSQLMNTAGSPHGKYRRWVDGGVSWVLRARAEDWLGHRRWSQKPDCSDKRAPIHLIDGAWRRDRPVEPALFKMGGAVADQCRCHVVQQGEAHNARGSRSRRADRDQDERLGGALRKATTRLIFGSAMSVKDAAIMRRHRRVWRRRKRGR